MVCSVLVNSEISSVLCMCNYNCSSGLVTDIMFGAPRWTGNSINIYIYMFFFVPLLESIISLHINWLKYRPAMLPMIFEVGSTPRELGTACWHQELSTFIMSQIVVGKI